MVLAASQLIRPLALTLHGMAGDRINIFVGEQLILAANRWRGLARFEDPDFADDLMRARGGGTQSGLELMYFGAEAVVSLVTVIALLVVLGGLHFLVPILLVLVTLPQIAQHYVFLVRTGGALYDQTPDARRLEYSRDLLLTAPPAKDVRLYDMGSFLARRYDAIFARTTSMLDSLRKTVDGVHNGGHRTLLYSWGCSLHLRSMADRLGWASDWRSRALRWRGDNVADSPTGAREKSWVLAKCVCLPAFCPPNPKCAAGSAGISQTVASTATHSEGNRVR